MTLVNYFVALFLTLIIELIIIFLFGYRKKEYFIAVIFINLITHPLINYFLWANSSLNIIAADFISIIWLEILVVIIESVLLFYSIKQKYFNLLKLSLCMNMASFIFGLLFFK